MGLATRELFQYMKVIVDDENEVYKVMFQDVLSSVDLYHTHGALR